MTNSVFHFSKLGVEGPLRQKIDENPSRIFTDFACWGNIPKPLRSQNYILWLRACGADFEKSKTGPVGLRLGSGTHSLHSGWVLFVFVDLVNEPPEAVASAEGSALSSDPGAGAQMYGR